MAETFFQIYWDVSFNLVFVTFVFLKKSAKIFQHILFSSFIKTLSFYFHQFLFFSSIITIIFNIFFLSLSLLFFPQPLFQKKSINLSIYLSCYTVIPFSRLSLVCFFFLSVSIYIYIYIYIMMKKVIRQVGWNNEPEQRIASWCPIFCSRFIIIYICIYIYIYIYIYIWKIWFSLSTKRLCKTCLRGRNIYPAEKREKKKITSSCAAVSWRFMNWCKEEWLKIQSLEKPCPKGR